MIMPVDYMYSEKVFSDNEYALKYSKENIKRYGEGRKTKV